MRCLAPPSTCGVRREELGNTSGAAWPLTSMQHLQPECKAAASAAPHTAAPAIRRARFLFLSQ